MVNLVNLTRHELKIRGSAGDEVILPAAPKGQEARVRMLRYFCGHYTFKGVHIPLSTQVVDRVENLPPPETDTVYIVSTLVRLVAEREDLASPAEFMDESMGHNGLAFSHDESQLPSTHIREAIRIYGDNIKETGGCDAETWEVAELMHEGYTDCYSAGDCLLYTSPSPRD